MTALLEISLDVIEVSGNPRDSFDQEGDGFKALVESVKNHGIITPITVEPLEDDGFRLIAGQRRIAAAKAAGLISIPAQVIDANGSALAKSVSENLHREAMTPMQEARAFRTANETMSLEDIASSYSVSIDLVRERLRLLKLPESLQTGVDNREIPLGAANLLSGIADHSEPLAKAVADVLADEHANVTLSQLTQNTGTVLRQAITESDDPTLVAFDVAATQLRPSDARSFTEEQITELEELWERKPEYSWSPLLDKADIEAADAFGCLLEVVDSYGRETRLITDGPFLWDRLKPALEKLAKKGDKDRADRKKRQSKIGNGPSSGLSEEEEKAKAKEERDEQRVRRIAAITRNLDLGEHLATVAKEVPIDRDVMAIFGEMILENYGLGLFNRGLRYTSDEFKHVTPAAREGSVPKVERTSSTQEEAKLAIRTLWDKQKTPEQMAGFLIQLMIASAFSDQAETSQNDRRAQPIPWLTDHGDGLPHAYRDTRGAKALNKLGMKFIPKSVKVWAKAQQTERAERLAASEAQAKALEGDEG